ncbi:iron ABC transporter permease [Desulfosporosinus sp. FKA]|uniref:FecCD family ABC transporter permease n=1 Tax=Desulfosporosinus sp. FKA TaxID=1969834 RepID=UPI000B4A21AD|nr:iron ABC transporter permease [Desulfosporosinus sp. FKA]
MKRKIIPWTVGLLFLLFLTILASLSIGSVYVPFGLSFRILLDHLPYMPPAGSLVQNAIIWELRLPRIFLAVLVGAMLSASGVAFQGILRNPLADPYILGVSVGAALGAAGYIVYLHNIAWLGQLGLPLVSFAGGIVSLALVLVLAEHHGQRDRETLILSGVVIQSLFGAFLTFLIAIAGHQMQEIVFWMMGSLANSSWQNVVILLPYFIAGMVYLLLQYRDLNVIALGERAATYLGMEVEKKKIAILAAGTLLTAAAVSQVGIIGFVGLIVPHLMRLVIGPDHKVLLPLSTVAGAIFLLWSDTIARAVIPSQELPIGVVTAFVGAPFFAYLLKKGLRRGKSESF